MWFNTLPPNTINYFTDIHTLKARDISQEFILNNLPETLKAGLFANSLCARPPKTIDKLQDRAVEFMHIEDMCAFRKKQQVEATVVASGRERKDEKKSISEGDKRGRSTPMDLPQGPKFN